MSFRLPPSVKSSSGSVLDIPTFPPDATRILSVFLVLNRTVWNSGDVFAPLISIELVFAVRGPHRRLKVFDAESPPLMSP